MGAKNSAVVRVILVAGDDLAPALGFVVGGVLAVGMRAAMAQREPDGRAVPRPLRRDADRHDRDVLVRRAALDRQGPPPRPRVGLQRIIIMDPHSHSPTRSARRRRPRRTSLARLVGTGKTTAPARHAVAALADATLDIRPGEVTLIEGPSGSGKTTLISILGLLLKPTAGEVWLEGKNVAGLGERELPGAARAQLRLRVSGLQPVPGADRARERRDRDPDEGSDARRIRAARRSRLLELVGLGAARAPPARRSLGRPEAARRDRPRARRQPADPHRRRADRRARYQDRALGDGAVARARELARPRRRRRHPRPAPRALRRPRRPRRGRPHFSRSKGQSS